MKPTYCIVIPIYKSKPDKYEIKSFCQCLKVFKHHPVCLVAPDVLNTKTYINLLKNHTNYRFELFDRHFFNGIKGYNQLLLSPDFYRRFLSYDYILIYQLDAYVFSDNLDYWCAKGLDYLGAPVPFGLIHDVEITHNAISENKIYLPHAYNGGASLRKVETFFRTTTNQRERIDKWFSDNLNEDIIFSSLLLQTYKIPDSEALNFCIDNFPRENYLRIGSKFPMLCHGWTKFIEDSAEYDGLFWMKYIWKKQYYNLRTRKRVHHILNRLLHKK